jgi:hypothetical protein
MFTIQLSPPKAALIPFFERFLRCQHNLYFYVPKIAQQNKFVEIEYINSDIAIIVLYALVFREQQ